MVVSFKDVGKVHRSFTVMAGLVPVTLLEFVNVDSVPGMARFGLVIKGNPDVKLFFDDVQAAKVRNFMLDMSAPDYSGEEYEKEHFIREDMRGKQ